MYVVFLVCCAKKMSSNPAICDVEIIVLDVEIIAGDLIPFEKRKPNYQTSFEFEDVLNLGNNH